MRITPLVRALVVCTCVVSTACPPLSSQQTSSSKTADPDITASASLPDPLSTLAMNASKADRGDLTISTAAAPAAATTSSAASVAIMQPSRHKKLPDFNRNIFYKNKTENSMETGWLPNNIPFVFDFLVGSKFTTWPLRYTLVPNLASVRWQIDNPWGWKFLRGTTEFSFSGSYTAIPRGAETRYFAYDYGIRRYFVQPRWRVIPYIEGRGGIGDINAKGPRGVEYAQGQDMTFTLMMGSGARYNITPRFAVSAGATYMHVSNFYLSEPKYENFGINVWGPMAGVYMRLGKPRQAVAY